MDIPKDFDSKWEFSDVILIAEDAEGNEKELHANRMYLATYSSVFKSMFFSSFKEANSESVKVSCNYETMKLILQIIYGPRHDLITVKLLEIGILPKLYKAADYYDFPAVQKMCIHQMISRSSVEMATAALSIASVGEGLHDILMEVLEKLNPEDIKKFMSVEDSQLLFSKKDVKRIYSLIVGKELPKPANMFTSWAPLRLVSDLSKNFKNGGADCTLKWPRADVLFKTRNSDGKELYSNKTVLAMVSSHFADVFYGHPKQEMVEFTEIEVDVDYMVMKNVLTIIHHCYDNCNLAIVIKKEHFLLYSMYCAASKENLDIPTIRNICVKGLAEHMDYFNWELATSVKLEVDERLLLVKKIEAKEVCNWIFNCSDTVSCDHFSTYNDDPKRYLVYFTSETKSVVSLSDVHILVEKLLKTYSI